MKVAISQSSFIPWPGYFFLINAVDIFYFYDDTQYTSRDWRNRNYIKCPNGKLQISIPVKKHYRETTIENIEISKEFNKDNFFETLRRNYKKSFHYDEILILIDKCFSDNTNNLSKLNQKLIKSISEYLEIETEFQNTNGIGKELNKSDRLIKICQDTGAKSYFSGPTAKTYLEIDKFLKNDIEVVFINYPEFLYKQLWGKNLPNLSILDLLFNYGKDSIKLIKYEKN